MKRKPKPRIKISAKHRSTAQERHNNKHPDALPEKDWIVKLKELGEMLAPYVEIALVLYRMCKGE